MHRDKLVSFIDKILDSNSFKDSSKNGLQVEGKKDVKSVIFSPSISLSLINKAIELKADAIITHHGLFWGKEQTVTGSYAEKLRLLLGNNINLMSWHLPLDAHPKYGNNAALIRLFPTKKIFPFAEYNNEKIGFKAVLKKCLKRSDAFSIIKDKINPDSLFLPFGPECIKTVGVVSGGAQNFIYQAIAEGLDLYITGEASEYCFEAAREGFINFSAAGHYATEKAGVLSLKKLLEKKFKIKTFFYDSQNPI